MAMGFLHQVRSVEQEKIVNRTGVGTENKKLIFTHSGPGIVLSLLFIIPAIPKVHEKLMEKENLQRVDVIGALLSLAWPTMLVFALEQGGDAYAWNSSQIIGTLTGSGASLIAFGIYEVWVQRQGRQEPIFPVKLLKDPMLSLNIMCVSLLIFQTIRKPMQLRLINFALGPCLPWAVVSMRR